MNDPRLRVPKSHYQCLKRAKAGTSYRLHAGFLILGSHLLALETLTDLLRCRNTTIVCQLVDDAGQRLR